MNKQVNEVTPDYETSCTNELELSIRRMADLMHRLNQAIVAVVEQGATVEMLRCSRHHGGNGAWGDQLQPIVSMTDTRRN